MSVFDKKAEEQAAADAEAAKIAGTAEEEGDSGIGSSSYVPVHATETGEPDMEDMTPEERAQLDHDLDKDIAESEALKQHIEGVVEEVDAFLAAHPGKPKITEWPFTDTRYGNTHKLLLQVEKYYHGGLISLSSFDMEDMEPFAQYSVNVGAGLPNGCVAVKDWSEGEGNVEVLKENGVIEGDPVAHVPSGYVIIPIYALTQAFKDYLASV